MKKVVFVFLFVLVSCELPDIQRDRDSNDPPDSIENSEVAKPLIQRSCPEVESCSESIYNWSPFNGGDCLTEADMGYYVGECQNGYVILKMDGENLRGSFLEFETFQENPFRNLPKEKADRLFGWKKQSLTLCKQHAESGHFHIRSSSTDPGKIFIVGSIVEDRGQRHILFCELEKQEYEE